MNPTLGWIRILALPLTGHVGKFLGQSPLLLLKGDDIVLSSQDCCKDRELIWQVDAENRMWDTGSAT